MIRVLINISACICLLILASCQPSFEPIEYGKDACVFCKMTIVDRQFAAEIVTAKGRAYKFDDILCLKQYYKDMNEQDSNTQFYVADYSLNNEMMLDAANAIYLQNEFFASPMNGNYAAFASKDAANHYKDSLKTEFQNWNTIQ